MEEWFQIYMNQLQKSGKKLTNIESLATNVMLATLGTVVGILIGLLIVVVLDGDTVNGC